MKIAKTMQDFEQSLTADSYSIEFEEGCYKEWKVSALWELSNRLPGRIQQTSDFTIAIQKWIDFASYTTPDGRKVAEFDLDHFRRIHEADLSYPIIVSCNGNIMDGMHRLMKAYLGGHTIKVTQFEIDPEPSMVFINN